MEATINNGRGVTRSFVRVRLATIDHEMGADYLDARRVTSGNAKT